MVFVFFTTMHCNNTSQTLIVSAKKKQNLKEKKAYNYNNNKLIILEIYTRTDWSLNGLNCIPKNQQYQKRTNCCWIVTEQNYIIRIYI